MVFFTLKKEKEFEIILETQSNFKIFILFYMWNNSL